MTEANRLIDNLEALARMAEGSLQFEKGAARKGEQRGKAYAYQEAANMIRRAFMP